MTAVLYAPEHWLGTPLEMDANAQLVGGRCTGCQHTFFPRFKVCPNCLSTEPMAELRLSKTGKLYSYSVIHTNSPGFKAPYAVAYVDMPEGPRLFGHLDGWQDGELQLDSQVEMYSGPIGKDGEGNEMVSVRFRPTASNGRQQ